jgi:hypothetical protein
MKTYRMFLSLVLLWGCVLCGFMGETASAADGTAKEKAFLADPDVAVSVLEKTTVSKLDWSSRQLPSFVRRMERAKKTDLRQAAITISGRPFKVLLGEQLDHEFCLLDVEKGIAPYWWGSWSLHSFHKIDKTYYQFVLVDNETRIAVRPYRGDIGTIKVGKGGRAIEKAEFNGSVMQAGSMSAPIGIINGRSTKPVSECVIPVGDYTSYIMHVKYDNLDICISNNYHTDAQGKSRGDRETVYGMAVCKDKPYVLDFSNKPVVVFDQPSKSKDSFARGEEIKFADVLVDPKLDIMIRGLDDKSVQVEKELTAGRTYKRSKSLDPKVVITRADGEVVAEGVMPFG